MYCFTSVEMLSSFIYTIEIKSHICASQSAFHCRKNKPITLQTNVFILIKCELLLPSLAFNIMHCTFNEITLCLYKSIPNNKISFHLSLWTDNYCWKYNDTVLLCFSQRQIIPVHWTGGNKMGCQMRSGKATCSRISDNRKESTKVD